MATYDSLFSTLGLKEWCAKGNEDGPMSMADLLAKANGKVGSLNLCGTCHFLQWMH